MVSTGLLRNDVQVILFAQLFIKYLLPGYKIGTRTKGNQGKKYLIALKKVLNAHWAKSRTLFRHFFNSWGQF